jgi:hypothetical protein
MGKPNRGWLGKPLGWGEGWEGSRSAAGSHIFFLEIRREFGGHKNFVLHPSPTQMKIDGYVSACMERGSASRSSFALQ